MATSGAERDPTYDPLRDPVGLASGQYRSEANLRARASLHERFSSGTPWHTWLFDQLPDAPTLRVLELGCGGGRFWRDNASRVPPGWSLTLTDVSPGMLEAASTNLAGTHLPIRYERVDASQLVEDERFGDGSFDVVLANHMLYHVPDIAAALRGVRRALVPGGRLYAATNGAGHMAELYDLAGAVLPRARRWSRRRLAFDLENGDRWLAAHFDRVRLIRREDVLRVTDADAAVDYLASMVGSAGLAPDARPADLAEALGAAREAIFRTIDQRGAMSVHRVAGVFEAS